MSSLNKLMWRAGIGKMNKESLARLFAKIPKEYQKIVLSRLKSA
jgi:hypothetical protein